MKYIFTKSSKRSERANIFRKIFSDISKTNGKINNSSKSFLKILNPLNFCKKLLTIYTLNLLS